MNGALGSQCTHRQAVSASVADAPARFAQYSRLFPPAREAVPDEKLVRLADAMRYTDAREGMLTPRVGYTYLGQFIGHDISHDGTPLGGAIDLPERTPNYRTPFLDLDHLYGGGPATAPRIYTGPRGAELFKIGRSASGAHQRDVALEDGELLVADPHDRRNLDNLILRQLQVIFFKLHNEAVRQLSAKGSSLGESVCLRSRSVFDAAQQIVRWHYQRIVRHDFLPRILHRSFWMRRRVSRSPCAAEDFALPIEFTLAAFRYGHTIVRRTYPLNCKRTVVELRDLLVEGPRAAPLPDESLIEWGRYFDGLPRSGPVAASGLLDTAIADALHAMPGETVQLCSRSGSKGESPRLAERTLLRGSRSAIASGQQIAATLIEQGAIAPDDALSIDELVADTCNRSGSMLRELHLEANTPLFYYLLKEAELRGSARTLGPVGSYIVGDVLLGALEADPEGYIAVQGNDWQLPLWEFPNGNHEQVGSMISAIRLIGDHTLLPQCAGRGTEVAPRAAGRPAFA